MSKAEILLSRLLSASKGVNSSERQAEARVRTNDFFDLDRKEMKAVGLMAGVDEIQSTVQGLLDAATKDGHATLIEVYEASLSVFAKWTTAQDAA
ncbi:hypothetical protein [Paramagnetospirillum kuznetsovii]|nr:hypothetical protein [Paramagnetospirillum kuznetsovii]